MCLYYSKIHMYFLFSLLLSFYPSSSIRNILNTVKSNLHINTGTTSFWGNEWVWESERKRISWSFLWKLHENQKWTIWNTTQTLYLKANAGFSERKGQKKERGGDNKTSLKVIKTSWFYIFYKSISSEFHTFQSLIKKNIYYVKRETRYNEKNTYFFTVLLQTVYGILTTTKASLHVVAHYYWCGSFIMKYIVGIIKLKYHTL